MVRREKTLGYIMSFILLFFSVFNFESYAIHYSSIYFILLPLSVYLVVKSGNLIIQLNHFILIGFWFLVVLSTIFSDSTSIQTNLITFFLFYISYFIITSRDYSNRTIKFLILSYVFISLLVSMNIILFYTLGVEHSWGRYSLVFFDTKRDPNYVLAYVIPAFYFILYYILFIAKKNRMIEVLALITITISIFITGSRAPLIICGIISLVLFLKKVSKLSFLKKIMIILITCVVVLTLLIVIKSFINDWIFNRIFNFENYFDDIRIQIWIGVLKSEKAISLFGHGFGAANNVANNLIGYNTHNVYLDILYDFGILGLCLLSFILKDFIIYKFKLEYFLLAFSFFSPLFFINGFNTMSFWLPLTFTHIIYNYLYKNKMNSAIYEK